MKTLQYVLHNVISEPAFEHDVHKYTPHAYGTFDDFLTCAFYSQYNVSSVVQWHLLGLVSFLIQPIELSPWHNRLITKVFVCFLDPDLN